jgi:hypothetical protein
LDKSIPATWEFNADQDCSLAVAHLLVDAGLLTEAHVVGRPSLQSIIETYFTDSLHAARPTEMADLCLSITDDVLNEFNVHWDSYAKKYSTHPDNLFEGGMPCLTGLSKAQKEKAVDAQRTPDKSKLRALVIAFGVADGMHCETIGPALEALDQWPRVGQSVLAILEDGLQHTTRCISPGTSLSWAGSQYWMGENDESLRVEEELEYVRDDIERKVKAHNAALKTGEKPVTMPTDEEIIKDQICHFTRKDLDASIPPKWHQQCKPLPELPLTLDSAATLSLDSANQTLIHTLQSWPADHARRLWPEIYNACQRIRELRRLDSASDNELCENVAWECCPFMLRLHDHDCLVQIADDTWQDISNAGEANMEVNSMFLWHDAPSFVRAFQRVQNFLALVHACEDLIRLLRQTPEQIKIPIAL